MSLVSPERLVADSPWTGSDLRRSGVWTGVGLFALTICCVGVSRAKTYDNQLLWTALGAIALAVAVIGGVRWILRGMRTVRRERRDVMDSLSGLAADEVIATDVDGLTVYFTAAMSRFHTRACPFARGKDLVPASRSDARSRRPCEVCEP